MALVVILAMKTECESCRIFKIPPLSKFCLQVLKFPIKLIINILDSLKAKLLKYLEYI